MLSPGNALHATGERSNTWIATEDGENGWRVEVRNLATDDYAILEPLALVSGGRTFQGRWETVSQDGSDFRAVGVCKHPGGSARFTLEALLPAETGPLALSWRVQFETGSFTGALLHVVTLPGTGADNHTLDLPSIHYASNIYGTGIFPRPDPRRGFSFRADRMAQPAIHLHTENATWSYFAENEAPASPQPDLLYSLGVEPQHRPDGGGVSLRFRYPQQEYGHRGDGGPDAYIAKSTFGQGETATVTWESGATLEKRLYLWLHDSASPQASATVARFLWARAYPQYSAQQPTTSMWGQAAQHIRWYNSRLYNPALGGGQFESPEGSGTAMLGFVEQSLLMGSVAFVYASLALRATSPRLSQQELEEIRERAGGVITRWCTDGRSEDGLLYPYCDEHGYGFGQRMYSDYENLTISNDGSFDTIRLATECTWLLSAARSARSSGNKIEVDAWESAAVGVADWFLAHALPGGGYSTRYRHDGAVLDPYSGGTGAVISLFCECTHLLRVRASRTAESYLQAAIKAYESNFAAMVRAGRFAGGTLDASTPDREAAVSALDACIQLYELTGEEQYLTDACLAAGNLLSYTMVYPISTFGIDTDAANQGISTFGATIVSPENQHLDPVPTAPGLVAYGLYAGDDVCVQAGIEALKFALDGRWAVMETDGLKQSEQLLHTRWFYNTFFSRRGDFRRGMPLWGREDSEHGWPQVVPTASLLSTGQVLVDWVTARAAGIDGWQVEATSANPPAHLSLHITRKGTGEISYVESSLLLKVLRMPEGGEYPVTVAVNERQVETTSTHLAQGFMLDVQVLSNATITITIPFRS